jgi:uncharacterized lipoprotein YbaY
MIRRLTATLGLVAALAISACNGAVAGPALTDPTAIVTAALTSTEAAKSVHLDVTVDGTASVALPIGGGTGTSVDLTGTTASADIDFAKPAARATFAVPNVVNLAGELIAVDGKEYIKTTLTGPLYQQGPAATSAFDPTDTKGIIDNLGDLLLKPGVTLVKGDDIACGSKSCYTVSANLTAANLGTTGSGAIDNLPVDLTGATLQLTLRVEKDLPYHLAGITAVVSLPKNATVTVQLTASKWDVPVTVTAPSADQVKPS